MLPVKNNRSSKLLLSSAKVELNKLNKIKLPSNNSHNCSYTFHH